MYNQLKMIWVCLKMWYLPSKLPFELAAIRFGGSPVFRPCFNMCLSQKSGEARIAKLRHLSWLTQVL